MKKMITIFTLAVSTFTFSQNSTTLKSNDIVINPVALVLGAVNVEYERIISENSGIGVTTSFLLDDYIIDDNNGFSITPYYNYYFGKKRANGFYIGGYCSINSGDVEKSYYVSSQYGGYTMYTTEKETNFGVGFKFGGKWVVKNDIVLEIGTGLGRNFGGENKVNTTGMLGIGKRF